MIEDAQEQISFVVAPEHITPYHEASIEPLTLSTAGNPMALFNPGALKAGDLYAMPPPSECPSEADFKEAITSINWFARSGKTIPPSASSEIHCWAEEDVSDS